jgi:hypothetical protein
MMARLSTLALVLLACGGDAKDECRDYAQLSEPAHVQAFVDAMECTKLGGDLPNLLATESVPCPDGSGKWCNTRQPLGAHYERACDLIVIQHGAAPGIVEHESIHHLLAVNGTPVHDHCHPAFISCDPLKPRPQC